MTCRTPLDQVLASCQACLQNAGVTPAVAASVAGARVAAEAEGNRLCGLYYLPVFLAQLASGRIRKTAVAQVERRLPTALAISADGGFAQPALDLAVSERLTRGDSPHPAAALISRRWPTVSAAPRRPVVHPCLRHRAHHRLFPRRGLRCRLARDLPHGGGLAGTSGRRAQAQPCASRSTAPAR